MTSASPVPIELARIAHRQDNWQSNKEGREARKPAPKPKPRKLSRDRRRHLILNAADILKKGGPTFFAFEGATIHGLRAGFCLDGWGWAVADATAADIVGAALRLIGAQRPTCKEGQPEWAQEGFSPVERTRCAHCARPIPKDRRAAPGRPVLFCSDVCGKAAYARRAAISGETTDMVEYLASRAARRERTMRAEIPCEQCGESFRPGYRIARQRFCSPECATDAQRQPKLPKQACAGCGTSFQPRRSSMKYCSHECYQKIDRGGRNRPERTCPVCKTIFRAASPQHPQVACSRSCGWELRRMRAPMKCEPAE